MPDKVRSNHEALTTDDVMEAIDGGEGCSLFWCETMGTYLVK